MTEQNQGKVITNSAKQFMLSKSAINMKYDRARTTSISFCHSTMGKRYQYPFEKQSNRKGPLLNKTLQMTKLTFAYFMGCLGAEGGIQLSFCVGILTFPEPHTVPKSLDDQIHIMTFQIISCHSTLMRFLYPSDDSHYQSRNKTSLKP